MRVQFIQSGGVLGTVKGCELDTAALPADAADELRRLVAGSGLTASAETLSAAGRDLQQYEITIEDGKRKVSVVLDNTTVPPAARALVGYLKKCARPRPLD